MFKVITNKGFQMTFVNGWTISVMFGYGNYCDNRDVSYGDYVSVHKCKNAEIGVWYKNGGVEVNGWLSADKVAEAIAEVSGLSGYCDARELKCISQ